MITEEGQRDFDERWAGIHPANYGIGTPALGTIYYSKVQDPERWDAGDMIYMDNPWEMSKEMSMNLTADYEGKIKRIGNQFLLKLGCQEFICQTLSDVGKKITAVLYEEYKQKDTPDEDE